MEWATRRAYLLLKIVEEGGEAFESLLLLVLYLELELDLSLADAANVGYVVKHGCEAHALAGEDRLAELHLVHAVVYKHLDIVHLNDLLPQMGQEGQSEVTVSYG